MEVGTRECRTVNYLHKLVSSIGEILSQTTHAQAGIAPPALTVSGLWFHSELLVGTCSAAWHTWSAAKWAILVSGRFALAETCLFVRG